MTTYDRPEQLEAYSTAVRETKTWLADEIAKYKEEGNDEYNRGITDAVNAIMGLYKGQPT